MRGLLVDNGSTLIVELIASFRALNISLIVVGIEALELPLPEVDFAILSGSSQHSVQKYAKTIYAPEIKFLQTTNLPVLGICMGAELVATAFAGGVRKLPKKLVEREHIVTVTECDGLFEKNGEIAVYESHHWRISDVGEDLTVLASSETGIEAIKHNLLPIYGVQFHPELSGKTGEQIFKRFVDSIR